MQIIERELTYFKGSPVMVLKPARRDNKQRFVISLDDLWKYSDSHNVEFENFMVNRVVQLCMLFGIDVPRDKRVFAQVMASVADTIMSGIDEMVKMPPQAPGAENSLDAKPVDAQFDDIPQPVGMVQ